MAIVAYSCVEMGERLWSTYSADQREYLRQHPPEWCTSSLKNDRYLKAVIGCEKLELSQPHLRFLVEDHAALARFTNEWEEQHGPDARVRIDVDWILEAIRGTGISYPELAVLAGIYSKIGAKKGAVRITQSDIWRRAHGFKSDRVAKVENISSQTLISLRQVRTVIEKLHTRGFFSRVTFARRQSFYSNRLTPKQLSESVFKLKTKRDAARHDRRMADAALTGRIQAERRRFAAPQQAA